MTLSGLAFGHLGFYAHDIEKMADFYSRVLEFSITDRGEMALPGGRIELVFLSRDADEHHQLALIGGRPKDVPFNVINQISFSLENIASLQEVLARFRQEGLQDIHSVTHGNALSVYALDPEQNRLEIYFKTPWYVVQPMRVEIDLDRSEAEILAAAEAHARSLPGFCTRKQWNERMSALMRRH